MFSFLPFQIYVKNNSYNYFELRYKFNHNIRNFSYPEKLLKKRYKFYWLDFAEHKSSLTWFEPLKIDLNTNSIYLDIKSKFVIKKRLDSLEMKHLSIFLLSSYEQYQLFQILKLKIQSDEIKNKVKEFCDEKNYPFLFEKGISKIISF
ncbi:hypothetical protein [Mesoplasma corruscae]|uniref:Uncharacterized protein n=1 Tax=Mesoplasma corruscae TaxID=216874 RepID=A0A2S5RG34_9MOLU|nr:hypothetical protein [Mesoplasma corruscae]PPE06296.1 hypothetical protein MCORR_v1c06010 [Mesoplasma corruscae]